MADWRKRALVLGIAAVVGVAVVAGVVRLQRLPTGPVDIAWDREACAHCHMLIGDPAFAAQIQTRDGRVFDFDDPGCLLAFEEEQHPDEHAVYFHVMQGDAWLPRERAAFVPVDHSPMGYDLGVVEASAQKGSLTYDQARARVRGPERAHDDAP